jgi:hypothetical protein
MMGGGGPSPSSVSQRSAADVKEAVEEKIAEIASKGQRIIIGCEPADREKLNQLIDAIPVGSIGDLYVVSSSDGIDISNVSSASLVVSFSDRASTFEFLNQLVKMAATAGKLGIHAKATVDATVPASVGTYRWRAYLWEDAIKMLG